jgi:hypothetical protein
LGAARLRRTFHGMTHDHRMDLRLPRTWRKELDELAAEVGLSSSDIARLSIRFLLNHRDRLVKIRTVDRKQGAGK